MRGFEYLVYSAISLSLLVVLLALPLAPIFAAEITEDVHTNIESENQPVVAVEETITAVSQDEQVPQDVDEASTQESSLLQVDRTLETAVPN